MPSSLTDPTDPMTGVGNGKLTGSTAQGVWEAGVIDYKGIKANMLGADNTGINGFEYGYDAQAEAPWVWNRTSGQLITFDDDRSVKAKGVYARSLGLAGLFSWEIDADNGDILNAMHEGLAGGTTPPANRAPTANAGAAQTVTGPVSVTLDGSASKDSDGTIASYLWEQTSGAAVTLSNANAAQASFTAPEVTSEQALTFKLTVTDNEGASASANVTVTVKPAGGNENNAPVAAVSAPAQVNAGETVVVDASASSDADLDTLTFNWNVPAGLNATVTGSTVTFVAPEYSQDTTLSFTVSVSDGQASASASTNVVVLKTSSGGETCDNLWDASQTYASPGTIVAWQGQLWSNKWYVNPNEASPDQSGEWGVWQLVGPADCSTN